MTIFLFNIVTNFIMLMQFFTIYMDRAEIAGTKQATTTDKGRLQIAGGRKEVKILVSEKPRSI